MKMKAITAVAAVLLVSSAANCDEAIAMATQVQVQPAMLNSMSLRRPTRSTKAAPMRAKPHWKIPSCEAEAIRQYIIL